MVTPEVASKEIKKRTYPGSKQRCRSRTKVSLIHQFDSMTQIDTHMTSKFTTYTHYLYICFHRIDFYGLESVQAPHTNPLVKTPTKVGTTVIADESDYLSYEIQTVSAPGWV